MHAHAGVFQSYTGSLKSLTVSHFLQRNRVVFDMTDPDYSMGVAELINTWYVSL